jgi:hypothetical protein
LQVDDAADVIKGAHLIIYVRYVLENVLNWDLLFCKPTDGTATLLEVFNIMNRFQEENEINWERCIGLCTDGVQSMSGQNAGIRSW